MSKRIFASLLIVTFFAACGDDTTPSNNNTTPDEDMPTAVDMPEDIPDVGPDAEPDMPVVIDMPDDMPVVEEMGSDTDMDMGVDMEEDTGEDTFDPLSTCLADCTYQGPRAAEVDCDYDGISNAEELQFGTDSCDNDTDGDGLGDLEEAQVGSDPLSADSDGDGLEDGREIEFGFSPVNPDSFNDGILDGDRWIVSACLNPASEDVIYYDNASGDWKVALPPAFTYANLNIATASPSNKQGAAVFDDPAQEVAGFLLSTESTGTTPSPIDVLRSYNLNSVAGLVRGTTGGEFDSWDGNVASIQREFRRTSSSISARQFRDQALFALAPFGAPDVTGLPSAAGNTYTEFRVFISVTVRADAQNGDRIITAVAVAPAEKYDLREKVKFRMDDLSNTTNVGQAGDDGIVGCTTFRATEGSPEADFYWLIDNSGSMNDNIFAVNNAADEFFIALQNSPLDYRLGVTSMDSSGGTGGRLDVPPGWHTDLPTFKAEIDNLTGFSEYGLRAAQEGITYMRSTSAPAVSRIRASATLVTVWFTDEGPQSLKNISSSNVNDPARLAAYNQYLQFFEANTVAFAIVAVYDECITGGGSAGPSDQGVEYQNIALATGGAFAPLCDPSSPIDQDPADYTETIEDIIIAASASASNFQLPTTPISSTLRIYKNDEWIPRSREDGFDYFAQNNSIAFFGSYRPDPADPVNNFFGDDISVSYQTFQDRTK